ncbi:unnamed protein product [Medioppia subpectinata]|uniref:Uncharacterized protein n=1 Tax=Medioppia subpectinata TaxID=1979941 RepID=A0A7R9KRH1_9ACAR|nr:unnamed protein product [Medioppia subpectinata]CAG2108462.1 unnamed protein product [Medioppia subpectinata]
MFQEAFLTTYRTLLTPMELIDKLLYRYNKFILLSDMRQRAARNAFALLVRVVDDMCIGDCKDKVLEMLMDFIYQLVNRGDLALAKVLRAKCIEKMDQRHNALNASKVLLPSINITSRQYSLCDFKSEHLAEQMTLLDSDLFLKIEIPEVLVWAKEQREELIPNLNTFTEHFNNMSYWTRSRILDEKDSRERERLVLKFIKIMKHLRKLSNFNSYLAILSALDSAPIRRLEWQRNITESLKEYSALIDSSSSFRAYRQALADTEPPCIPYIKMLPEKKLAKLKGKPTEMSSKEMMSALSVKKDAIVEQLLHSTDCQTRDIEDQMHDSGGGGGLTMNSNSTLVQYVERRLFPQMQAIDDQELHRLIHCDLLDKVVNQSTDTTPHTEP